MYCPVSKAYLSGPASRATFVDALFAALEVLAMSFITFLTALISGPLGLSIPNMYACGPMTHRLSAHCITAVLQGSREGIYSFLAANTRVNGLKCICP